MNRKRELSHLSDDVLMSGVEELISFYPKLFFTNHGLVKKYDHSTVAFDEASCGIFQVIYHAIF